MATSSLENVAHYFNEGTQVEISSNDEGFQGSWYIGSVIRGPVVTKKTCSKVLVEYETLMEDEASSEPLREELELVHLRPSLPAEDRDSYKFNDEVDAYHNDGWWEGVVTEVLEDDEYLVFFRGTREQIAFKSSQLRLHREWYNGEWVPPFEGLPETTNRSEGIPESARRETKKQRFDHHFHQGDRVEICTNEEGLEDAWFAAKIVKKAKGDKYLVEYETLRSEDNSDYLKEEVDSQHIRPSPPDIETDGFQVQDKVNAFYNEGWWLGVVNKVVRGGSYYVSFEKTGENLRFRRSDLRVHQEWKDGNWIVSSKDGKLE